MACMGNFQAFNWTPERENWKPATVNEAPTTDQYNTDDNFVEQCYLDEERHVGRKTWSESKHVRPMCQFADNSCCVNELRVKHVRRLCCPQMLRYGRTYDNRAVDNVKTLLRYDHDAAREWPYGPEEEQLSKIGPPYKVSSAVAAQHQQMQGDNDYCGIRARPSCHMTKFVTDMNKTYKMFKMYGQSGLAPPV